MRNELTKFGANPTMFEPPITGLKMTGSEPPNLDRFPFSFFFLSSHVVVCVFCSLPSHSSSYLSAQLRMEARVFSLLSFLGSISTVDSNRNQRCTSTGLVGYFTGLNFILHVEGQPNKLPLLTSWRVSLPSGSHASEPTTNLELSSYHHLSHHICPVVIGVDFLKLHLLRIQHISDPMITNINMF